MKTTFKSLIETLHQADPAASFEVRFWDGDKITYGTAPKFVLTIHSPAAAKSIMGTGFLGFAEAYMYGQIDLDGDIQEPLRLGMAIDFDKIALPLRQKLIFLFQFLKNKNRLRRSPKNIAHHYDKGNDFYALYLDKSMTYSCAYFKNDDDSLDDAQQNKYEHISRKLMLNPGETLVDIGCGWGGMIFYAAQNYGVNAVGITLSRNQFKYVQSQIKDKHLEGQVKVLYEDYRNFFGKFDKLVSIGMFEHVGKEYIPVFMNKVAELLKEGGLGLLHTIGKDTPGSSDAWTMKYIFPGGYVPALEEIAQGMGQKGFSVLDVENLRPHYAKTLDCWSQNFERNVEKVRNMFDDVFVKEWRLFLESSAAGFKYGNTRLFQVLFSNGINNRIPITRERIYREVNKKLHMQHA